MIFKVRVVERKTGRTKTFDIDADTADQALSRFNRNVCDASIVGSSDPNALRNDDAFAASMNFKVRVVDRKTGRTRVFDVVADTAEQALSRFNRNVCDASIIAISELHGAGDDDIQAASSISPGQSSFASAQNSNPLQGVLGCFLLAFGGLFLLCAGICVVPGMLSDGGVTNAKLEKHNFGGPFRIAEIEDQPVQYLIQVVVPKGSSENEVNGWHRKIVAHYGSRGKPLFINYYDSRFEVDRLVACGDDSNSVGWLGLEN